MADTLPRLKTMYLENICKELQAEFGYTSPMQYPGLEKIILSMGVGVAITNKKLLEQSLSELTLIAGQRAVKTRAKKSISNFKLREGMEIGAKVTLRGNRMYEFFDRFINIALPRVKDFRGLNPNSFDGHGNYSTGVDEQIIFPEIVYDKIERISGMNVAIVTSAATDPEARALLGKMGMPFRK